jgi:hypothetical protein
MEWGGGMDNGQWETHFTTEGHGVGVVIRRRRS